MKFNMKAVAASVLFAVAGSSQAAILSGFSASDGELFISIFRDTATPESMIIDTDISLFALRDGTTTGWTSSTAQTSAILSFLGTAPSSSFRFNAGGVTDTTDPFDTSLNKNGGFFISTNTVLDPVGAPLSSSGMETTRQATNNFIVEINNGYASTEVITGLNPGEPGYHVNNFLWGNNVGGTFLNTEGSVDSSLSLWNAFNASPDLFTYELAYSLIGQLNIDTVTGVASLTTAPVSAVPVPAAAWLLGSGLVGLVGVARRKTA